MSSETLSIQLCGKPFPVLWQSGDRRRFANRETCYELVSFEGMEQHDLDALRKGLPAAIEKCWLPNPNYKRNASREHHEWHHATGRGYDRPGQHHPPTHAGFYYPPEARDLHFINPKDPQVSASPMRNSQASLNLLAIGSELFQIPCSGPGAALLSKPGGAVFMATFGNGDIRFFKDVANFPIPPEVIAFFRAAGLHDSVERLLTRARDDQVKLEATQAELQKAHEAANLTLKEALERWMRFEPPGMNADTKARIEKAVKLYLTDPDKHSLAKIAAEFQVSRTTVSRWFKAFTQHTGFPVVTHTRHESVSDHLRAEEEEKRQREDAAEHGDDESHE